MKTGLLAGALLLVGALFTSCQDEVSGIGASLTEGEVTITVDSLETSIESRSVYYDTFDGRNVAKLLGRLNVPAYGSLDCSFVSQMMSATSMPIPDSISAADIDSMRLVLSVPRGALTGDSLAPQQLRAYRLTKQLPSDISSDFDPTGYYDASSLLGSQSYTLSVIAKGDSAVKKDAYVRIPVNVSRDLAVDMFNRYRAGDPMFQWPASFSKYFPGVYVEQNFGNGCVANISKVEFFTYWHYNARKYEMLPDSTYGYVDHIMRDSVCLMSAQPEVLSSNVISYKVSEQIKQMAAEGKSVLTTPGGYMVDIKFPVKRLLDLYHSRGDAMSVVSSLRMDLPARTIDNDHGIGVAPYLLMIKKAELESFFAENKIPDGKTSFYAAFDSDAGVYRFASMRNYFLDILELEKKGESIDADMEFVLVPVDVTTESVEGYNGVVTIYVTRCQPYLLKPTMTQLLTDRAIVSFTYSSQELE